jgi:predicted permease
MSWLKRATHRDEMETKLHKELQFHLDEHAKELTAQGYSPEEARRRARLEIGGPEIVKESCRDARGTQWLHDLGQDVRYALRILRKKPSFAAIALITLALGTGATTVMFTLVNGVLLKPLPYPNPERLVAVRGFTPTFNTAVFGEQFLAYPDFLDCKNSVKSLDMAGTVFNGGIVSKPEPADYENSLEITGNLFSVLGIPLYRGRSFLPEEDRPGGAPVAVISYTLWQSHFAGSDSAIGQSMSFDGTQYTIVGVAPPRFLAEQGPLDVFIPLAQDNAAFLKKRGPHPVQVFARLKPGATLAQAQTEFTVEARGLAQQFPDTNKDRTFLVKALRPDVSDVSATLWLLLGAVSLVLLIACANIASLLLARSISREREFGMRVALGAGRGRLVRQCLTESMVLGLGGGILGAIVAALGIKPFITYWPGSLPRAAEVSLDWRVMLFALGISLLCGLFFGLAPALRVPTRNLETTLRSSSRSVTSGARRLHSVFVISEIAIALVLLASAGMMGRTLLRLAKLDPGINIHNVLTSRVALSEATLSNTARTRAAWQEIINRMEHVPGVVAAAVVDTVPMREGNNQVGYWTSANLPTDDKQPLTNATCVTPDYMKVMRLTLREGRFFTDQDRIGSAPVVVIDDVMARNAFGNADPIGRNLWLGLGNDPLRVIGVVGHVRYWGLAADDQAKVRDESYYAFAQLPDPLVKRWSQLMSVVVRTSVPPRSIVEAVRGEVRGATGDQVLYQTGTMEEFEAASIAQQRFLLLLFGIFAGLALLLACIGIYGVLSYLTGQRTPEIGVRMALGATASRVVRMVLGESLWIISAGAALGILGAYAAGRVLIRSVDGMRSVEPATFALMVIVLVAAALAASYVPARRASKVDPITALRQE